MKKYLIYIFFIAIILVTYLTYNNKEEIIEINEQETLIVKEEETKIKVDVKGAVKNPGVYEFSTGQRVIDAIKKSGGTLRGAKTETLNLSKILEDQMVIYVYKFEEEELTCEEIIVCPIIDCEVPKNDACTDEASNLISINKASSTELQELPGIGEAKALDIINYRNTNNGFKSLEDIMNVTGIGESTFNKIKDFITL